jgi:hypothetical protein
VKISFQNLRFEGNIYAALLLRLMLVMLLFSVCRVGFYLFNSSFFPGMTFGNFLVLLWGGLKFDLVAVLYVNLLFILLVILPFDFRYSYSYQEILKYLFFILNGFALATNVVDFIYYRFTLRRTTADVFTQFKNEQNMTGLLVQFLIDYWYALVFWTVLIVLMVKMYNRIKVWGPQLQSRTAYYVTGILALPLIAGLIIVGIRGGIRHSTRPITLSNAGEYVRDPKDISIVLNTPFAIIRTLGKTKVQRINYFPENEVSKIFDPVHYPTDTAAFKNQNVVIIILESFSKEFFGAFNREKQNGQYMGYTPFLDSLIQHSRTYAYSFANGRKSIDGLPSVMSGIPSLGVPYFLSPFSGNKINSVASLLKSKNYHTSFFHGAPNGSMGFQAFVNLAGVENYYGMTEYNNDEDFDGLWGIWDEKFLSFYAEKLEKFPQPFMSCVFSVSSHHPFEIPKEYESKFKGGPLPIHKCVQYTDYSLKKFFEKASTMPWYQNTLFVITADHTSSNIEFPEYRTAWGLFSVPVIFFRPDHSLSGVQKEIFQQTDIMPSVLGYLNFDGTYVAFGRDDFKEAREPFAFNYKDNVYQFFSGDYLLQFDGTQSVGLYNFKTDTLLVKNVVLERPDVVTLLEPKVKAVIQQYNNRMIEDRMTTRDNSN